MRKFFLLFLLISLPAMANAAEKPPELSGSIKASAPVGKATFNKYLMHIYDVTFWSDSGGWAAAPYAISITYAMDFDADDLADRTRDEMHHVSNLSDAQLTHYTDLLRHIYPAVNEGDRITALQMSANKTVFYENGKKLGEIHDAAFAKPFFGIWLSPKSSEPQLQKSLLPSGE